MYLAPSTPRPHAACILWYAEPRPRERHADLVDRIDTSLALRPFQAFPLPAGAAARTHPRGAAS